MEIKWKLLLYQSKPLHLYIAGTTQEGYQKWEREKKNIYSLYGKEIANQYFYRGCLGLMQIEEMQVLMPDSESKSDYI